MESTSTACVNDRRSIDECLELLAVPPGPERSRCRAALAVAAPDGSARPALRAWFAGILGRDDLSLAAARAAFLLAGGAARWGGQLLAREPAREFVQALRAHLPVPVPPELPAPMPCPPLSTWARGPRLVGAPLSGAEGGES